MKRKLSVAVGLLATLIVVVSASAASATRVDYVGSSDAVASQTVTNVNSSTWKADFISKMVNPTVTINVLGRRWWTVREYCDLLIVHNHTYGGEAPSGSYYQRTDSHTKQPCSGDRFGRSQGKHDFNHTGANGYCPGEASTKWCPTLDTGFIAIP